MTQTDNLSESPTATDFIRAQVIEDLRSGRFDHVKTRFPPEPNGYLHIGHAKAFTIDFGIAAEFGGSCNLRFDDTNPVKEDVEYVDSIKEDIRWLGFEWAGSELYASDYFPAALRHGRRADQEGQGLRRRPERRADQADRGTLTEPGRNSRYRDRSVEENLDLFERMRRGEFPDGSRVLRAKIDMASGNINMRDPVMYRILHEPPHHRTGDTWDIYPMYDFAHGQSDSIEGITHSLARSSTRTTGRSTSGSCASWRIYAPRQIEFSRLSLTYTVLSKRLLRRLVDEGYVAGWDDPADADAPRPPPARLHGAGDPRLLRPDRGRAQGQQHGRHRAPRALPARGPQQARAPGDGGASAAESRDRELPRRTRSRGSRR